VSLQCTGPQACVRDASAPARPLRRDVSAMAGKFLRATTAALQPRSVLEAELPRAQCGLALLAYGLAVGNWLWEPGQQCALAVGHRGRRGQLGIASARFVSNRRPGPCLQGLDSVAPTARRGSGLRLKHQVNRNARRLSLQSRPDHQVAHRLPIAHGAGRLGNRRRELSRNDHRSTGERGIRLASAWLERESKCFR